VRDTINGVCYQRYEKRLQQQKRSSKCKFALQKKIWNGNHNHISIRLSFHSSKHTHTFLFVTQSLWIFIVWICCFWCAFWVNWNHWMGTLHVCVEHGHLGR